MTEENKNKYNSISEEADEFANTGKIEEAKKLLNKGRALANGKHDKAYIEFFNGELSHFNGNDEKALKHHQKAVALDPGNPFLLKNLGVLYSFLNKEAEAIEYFDKALSIKPDEYNSLRQKGVTLSKQGKEAEAIEYYDKALSIKPDDYDSLRNKGVSLSKQGKEAEAIEYYDKALSIKPDDYDSLRNKGVSLSNQGKEVEAIEYYNKALLIKPDDYDSLVFKAVVFENIDEIKKARNIYEQVVKNLDKIERKETRDFVQFKVGHYKIVDKKGKEVVTKGSDVLNKVINAFESRKESFFKSIQSLEEKFRAFTSTERSIPADFPSFLSVLRKWNSYTPILPSESGDNKGGGYFLYHKGKGIVIDPGFNFVENFYQEGFKVADIDAVLISHAHNDHTVDLESILTLIYKHNDAIADDIKQLNPDKSTAEVKVLIEKGLKDKGKKIDLFLNVGTFMKFSGWLNLKDSGEIDTVMVLQPKTTYSLPEKYNGIVIYTTKAKHHEVIDNKYAIGFILDIEGKKFGFTCDTGWDYENNGSIVNPFIQHKPKLIVAHLGSVQRKEFDYVLAKSDEERDNCFYAHHLGLLGITNFLDKTKPDLAIISEFGEELKDYRKEIAQVLNDVLKIKCLPADIGLHIRLDDLGVFCFIEEDFVSYKEIETYSKDSDISFHRNEPSHEVFITALEKKKHRRAVPLCKRVKSYKIKE